MQTHHRTWFPFILVGLTLALVLGVLAWAQSPSGGDVEALQVFAPTAGEYQADIKELLLEFEATGDLQIAYSELLETRVPAEYKQFHFDLALLFGRALTEEGLDISTDLATLRAQNNWLQ